MNATTATVTDAELRMLVERHEVSFGTRPIRRVAEDGDLEAVGFQIELLGVHHEPAHPPKPGCDECVLVYRDMRSIAEAVLPPMRESSLEVVSFEPKLVTNHRYGKRPVVELTIEILHRSGYEKPIDACEEQCRDDICLALRALGASPR